METRTSDYETYDITQMEFNSLKEFNKFCDKWIKEEIEIFNEKYTNVVFKKLAFIGRRDKYDDDICEIEIKVERDLTKEEIENIKQMEEQIRLNTIAYNQSTQKEYRRRQYIELKKEFEGQV